jgi:hypothetical protein
MLIDCDTCAMRDIACSDCVVTLLLDRPAVPAMPEFDEDECRAVDLLAQAGLIAPLRLVPVLHAAAAKPVVRRSIA